MSDRSISDILADLGVTHTRDDKSTSDGCHTLFYAGRVIGRYSAHDVVCLLRENGLSQ